MTRIPDLRIGIVGVGLMGRAHARASAHAGARVVGVADTDLPAAKKFASSIGSGVLSGTVDEIIRPDRVDAIHVCTPGGQHAEACAIAIERGVHVLCEKPMSETAAETQSLFALASERGITLCPVHQFPFQQGALDAAAKLPAIGKIRWITAEMCTAGATALVESQHNHLAMEIVPHPLSLIHAFLGGTLADGVWSTIRADSGEVLVTGTVRNTGISIVLSTHGRPTSNAMRLIGDRGTVSLDLFHGFSISEAGRVSRVRKFARPFVSSGKLLSAASTNAVRRGLARENAFPGLTELCRRFYLAADKRAEPPISPAEAIDIAIVRDRIVETLNT